jgi:hypothetical protein
MAYLAIFTPTGKVYGKGIMGLPRGFHYHADQLGASRLSLAEALSIKMSHKHVRFMEVDRYIMPEHAAIVAGTGDREASTRQLQLQLG